MANRCRKCGKFVAKDAKTCKYCGLENPIDLLGIDKATTNTSVSSKSNTRKKVQCPSCGAVLTLSSQVEKCSKLRCTICNKEFNNPLKLLGRTESHIRKYGCIIGPIIFLLAALIGSITDDSVNIKRDGKTIYIITMNDYAPMTKEASAAYVEFLAKNKGGSISILDYIYKHESDFTHMFEGDSVVVLDLCSSGYVVRKLRDFKTAVVPRSLIKECN